MLKRILVLGLLIIPCSHTTFAGKHLDALPKKIEALEEKGAGTMLGTVTYNLNIIVNRLKLEGSDRVARNGLLKELGFNVMASAFDAYAKNDISKENAYFQQVTRAMQSPMNVTYILETFAEQLGTLMDALLTGENTRSAFDTFIEYLFPEMPHEGEAHPFARVPKSPSQIQSDEEENWELLEIGSDEDGTDTYTYVAPEIEFEDEDWEIGSGGDDGDTFCTSFALVDI